MKRIPKYLQNTKQNYGALRGTILACADFYEKYPEGYEDLRMWGKWEYAILNYHGLKRNNCKSCHTCTNYDHYMCECSLPRMLFPFATDFYTRLGCGNPKRMLCDYHDIGR